MKNLAKILLLVLSAKMVFPQDNVEVKPKGVFAEINTSRDVEMIKELTAEDNEVVKKALKKVKDSPNQYIPPVLYMTAYVLFHAGEKEESLKWFFVGQLRGRYDANRCQDVSARQAVSMLNRNYGPDLMEFAFKNLELLKQKADEAILFVEKNEEDYDNRWINLYGMWVFTATEKDEYRDRLSFKKEDWPEIKKKTISDYKDGLKEILESIKKDKTGNKKTEDK